MIKLLYSIQENGRDQLYIVEAENEEHAYMLMRGFAKQEFLGDLRTLKQVGEIRSCPEVNGISFLDPTDNCGGYDLKLVKA